MVAKSDYGTSVAIRGPSSVLSRRSHGHHSRSKRYNRSHAGGTSYIPQNEFPVFSNSGDVEILVRAGGHENRYLLHRHTLTRCSGFFEASTSDQWSRAVEVAVDGGESPGNSTGDLVKIGEDGGSGVSVSGTSPTRGRMRWRYELDPGTGEGDIPMLVQKEPDSRGDTATSGVGGGAVSLFGGPISGNGAPAAASAKSSGRNGFFRSVTTLPLIPSSNSGSKPLSQADRDLLRDYDNLFRIFYNYPPQLDGVNVADAYVQCKSLLTLADQYDAVAVVGPRVDHHLLQFQSRLWRQIAKYPISYLRLGYLARSKVIFQEALIHVVGQWPAGERSLRSSLPDCVMEIIEDKVDELEESVSRVESRLFRLNLCTPRGERVTPATSYPDWLAVSLFRQWLADNTSSIPPPPDRSYSGSSSDASGRSAAAAAAAAAASMPPLTPLSSVGRVFRTMGSPDLAAYLGHDECKKFLKLSPEVYSRENLKRFEKRLEELKAMAREIVRPLMGSGLELDLGGGRYDDSVGVGYLTCTTVLDRDIPWLGE